MSKVWIAVFILVMGGGLFLNNTLQSQKREISDYKTKVDALTQQVEELNDVYATQQSVRKLKEDISLLLAQSTLIVESQTQVNINSIGQLKEHLNNESKQTGHDVNVLNSATVQWLQRYEAGRKN